MDDRLREIQPGWAVVHRNAHEAVVKEVRDNGVLARHDDRRNGPHEEFIPWNQVTSARPCDRFSVIVDHLRNIGEGHWDGTNPSVAEVITDDARWMVMQLAEESGAKLRLTEERDRAINALREAREENVRLRDGLSSIAAQPTGTTTYGYDEDADWDACGQCCIMQDIARATLGGQL